MASTRLPLDINDQAKALVEYFRIHRQSTKARTRVHASELSPDCFRSITSIRLRGIWDHFQDRPPTREIFRLHIPHWAKISSSFFFPETSFSGGPISKMARYKIQVWKIRRGYIGCVVIYAGTGCRSHICIFIYTSKWVTSSIWDNTGSFMCNPLLLWHCITNQWLYGKI